MLFFLILKIWLQKSHSDVEAQQVADHSGHGGQDDDPSDVVDQRVYSQTQQSERSIQLLEQVRRWHLNQSIVSSKITSQFFYIIQIYMLCPWAVKDNREVLKSSAVTLSKEDDSLIEHYMEPGDGRLILQKTKLLLVSLYLLEYNIPS